MTKRRFFVKSLAFASLSTLIPINASPSKRRKPNVLILGDSISIGYYPYVKEVLLDRVDLSRPMLPEGGFQNCEGTTNGLKKIDQWIGEKRWDIIHFNFGLHDIKHINPKTGKNSKSFDDPQQASPKQYEKNLNIIVKKLKKAFDSSDGPLRISK